MVFVLIADVVPAKRKKQRAESHEDITDTNAGEQSSTAMVEDEGK